jgi:hypothetical protein
MTSLFPEESGERENFSSEGFISKTTGRRQMQTLVPNLLGIDEEEFMRTMKVVQRFFIDSSLRERKDERRGQEPQSHA